jgi:type IX secretion system PorP/SprF family membrane protein
MKKFAIILLLIVSIGKVYAQQAALSTQYMHNPFLLNPAVAGTSNNYQMRLMTRMQWAGFTDAPFTSSISAYGPMGPKNKKMGVGAIIYNDVTNPTSSLGMRGAYAYNISVSEIYRMSFGATFGFMQFKFDGTKLINNLKVPVDPTIPNTVSSSFVPDATLGALFYSTNIQVGLSIDHLFNNSLNLTNEVNAAGLSKLKRNLYLLLLYTYPLNRRWGLEGSCVIKGVTPVYPQADFNARAIYKGIGWFGLSVRTQDGISVMGGYTLNKRLLIGYSADFSLFTEMRAYNFGSHELMIGYRFNSMKFR